MKFTQEFTRQIISEKLRDNINVRKISQLVIVFCLLEVLLLGYLFAFGGIQYSSSSGILIIASGILGGIVSIQAALALVKAYAEAKSAQQTLGDLESLNRAMSSQRHDFKNHIQVVYALIDMEEYEEAQKYLRRVNSDLENVSRAQKTSQPAINALLQAKLMLCQHKGISFELDVTSKLETLPVASWQICRMLGNLIDNAIDAITEHGTSHPRIKVSIFPCDDGNCMRVENNGPPIPAPIKEQIFLPDFSTKGENRGMGLAIVTEILEECGGTISLESDEGATVFSVTIPHANISVSR